MPFNDWIDETGSPIVYIFGIASHEGGHDARAGFGIDWGPSHPSLIKGGAAIGEKTALRAELTAVITVIQTAQNQKMPAITIRYRSDRLEEVLNGDRSTDDQFRCRYMGNEDLFLEIEKIINILPIKFEKTRHELIKVYANAVICARRVAGLHSSAAEPISDNQYKDGYRVVDIHGACNDGQPDAKAGYGVYWGEGDARNENGIVQGQQTSYRASFTALYRALSAAVDSHHDELIIRSRAVNVHNYLTRGNRPMGKHKDLCDQLESVMPYFKNVIHWMPPKERNVEELRSAENLAKLRSGNGRSHISIVGLETADDGLARYGVYWGEGDGRNQKGFLEGNHSQLCAEMTALEDAIKQGMHKDDNYIYLYIDSENLKLYLNNWRHAFKKESWPQVSTGIAGRCANTSKSLSAMLDSLSVNLIEGSNHRIDKARQLALSVQPFKTVRTFGAIQIGNNEPVARYGLYWLPDETDKEYGFIDGEQIPIRAKQMAILRALQISINNGITNLVIEHDCIDRENIDVKLERDINLLELKFEALRYKTHTSDEFEKLIESM